jgi:hypothetical protein
VLSLAALHELCQLRLCQRDPLGAARALDAGRTRSPALGAPGGHAGGGTKQVKRSRAFRSGSCPLLRIAISQNQARRDLFLLGLLSLMDSILELPMTDVLEKVPLDQEAKAVLLGGTSYLRPLYQLMLAQESGAGRTSELAKSLKLTESEVAEVYWQAMQWARPMNGKDHFSSSPRIYRGLRALLSSLRF